MGSQILKRLYNKRHWTSLLLWLVLMALGSRMVIQGGGLPIKFNGALVGGIGVGGAPGDHLDAKCARAGLGAIGAE